MENNLYTVHQAAERLGVSVRKVKYYSGLGLVVGIRRNTYGYRMLTEEQVAELGTVLWLRRCGLSMKKVRKYAALQRQGAGTREERIAILGTLRRQIWQNYEELQAQIDFIERQASWLEEEGRGGQF